DVVSGAVDGDAGRVGAGEHRGPASQGDAGGVEETEIRGRHDDPAVRAPRRGGVVRLADSGVEAAGIELRAAPVEARRADVRVLVPWLVLVFPNGEVSRRAARHHRGKLLHPSFTSGDG